MCLSVRQLQVGTLFLQHVRRDAACCVGLCILVKRFGNTVASRDFVSENRFVGLLTLSLCAVLLV